MTPVTEDEPTAAATDGEGDGAPLGPLSAIAILLVTALVLVALLDFVIPAASAAGGCGGP
jgi:hypothetical protein